MHTIAAYRQIIQTRISCYCSAWALCHQLNANANLSYLAHRAYTTCYLHNLRNKVSTLQDTNSNKLSLNCWGRAVKFTAIKVVARNSKAWLFLNTLVG